MSQRISYRAWALLVVVALSVSSLWGCGSDEQKESAQKVRTRRDLQPKPASISWYDGKGNLLPSKEKIAGLALPQSLEKTLKKDRRHVFRSRAPIEKLRAYFGRRLNTPIIERKRQGVIFRHARPTGAKGGVVLLDVSVLPTSSGKTRVEVYELPPKPVKPLGEGEVRKILKEQQKNIF